MDKKRILFAIVFLVVTILIGVLLWMVFFAPKPPSARTPTTGTGTPTDGSFPSIGQGGTKTPATTPDGTLPTPGTTPFTPGQTGSQAGGGDTLPTVAPSKKLLDVAVGSLTTDSAGGAKFYNRQDGKFYRYLPDGTVEALSDQTFFNVDHVVWSKTSDESIIEYPDGQNIYYNFDTKEQVTLPKHWEGFSFSPTSNQIAAKSVGFSPENRWLITADPNGNNITTVEPLGDNQDKVIVDWSPNQQIVALSLTGEAQGGYRQEVLFIGKNHENFKSTIVEGRGIIPEWSPSGEKLLYSVYSNETNFNPTLWVVNASGADIGSGRKPLQVMTWANKCSFGADDRYVYCGVPESLPNGAGFQPGLGNTTKDKLMKIDTVTGIQTELPLAETATINSISISDDGKTLYYTDLNSDGLYSVTL